MIYRECIKYGEWNTFELEATIQKQSMDISQNISVENERGVKQYDSWVNSISKLKHRHSTTVRI